MLVNFLASFLSTYLYLYPWAEFQLISAQIHRTWVFRFDTTDHMQLHRSPVAPVKVSSLELVFLPPLVSLQEINPVSAHETSHW